MFWFGLICGLMLGACVVLLLVDRAWDEKARIRYVKQYRYLTFRSNTQERAKWKRRIAKKNRRIANLAKQRDAAIGRTSLSGPRHPDMMRRMN